MTSKENILLNDFNDKFDRFLQSDMAYKNMMSEEMASVKRGLYGDEKNHVKGVIQQLNDNAAGDREIRKRVSALEDFKKQSLRWAAGAIAGLTMGINAAFYFLKTFIDTK